MVVRTGHGRMGGRTATGSAPSGRARVPDTSAASQLSENALECSRDPDKERDHFMTTYRLQERTCDGAPIRTERFATLDEAHTEALALMNRSSLYLRSVLVLKDDGRHLNQVQAIYRTVERETELRLIEQENERRARAVMDADEAYAEHQENRRDRAAAGGYRA